MSRAMLSSLGTVYPVRASQSLSGWLNDALKRMVDVVVAIACILILSPVFVLLAILIRRDSPGPVLFRGRRVGKDGRPFAILKFRTMKEAPASYQGARVTAEDDPRVTALGRRLRDTKLNELPQLWNVLKGDMSIVGPRPEDPEIVATWPEQIRSEIFAVRPGITSPASVLYRDEESLLGGDNVMETYLHSILPSKLRLDQLYVRHHTVWLDLDVIGWTALALLPMLRSFAPPEDLLFLGPISRFGRRYLNWFIIDALITLIAIGISGLAWRLAAPLDIGWLNAVFVAIGFACLFSVIGALWGMDRIVWTNALGSDVIGLFVSASMAGSIALGVNQLWDGEQNLPWGMIVSASILAFVGFVTVRYRGRLLSGLASDWLARIGVAIAAQERVIIVGSGSTGQLIAWLLNSGTGIGVFRVIGFVDDDLYKQGLRYRGINVIGRRSDIRRLVDKYDVGVVVFAIHNIETAERERLLAICRATPARIVAVPDIVGTVNGALAPADGTANPAAASEPVTPNSPLFVDEGIPPIRAQRWLASLERAAQAGDLGAVTNQVRQMREDIRKFTE